MNSGVSHAASPATQYIPAAFGGCETGTFNLWLARRRGCGGCRMQAGRSIQLPSPIQAEPLLCTPLMEITRAAMEYSYGGAQGGGGERGIWLSWDAVVPRRPIGFSKPTPTTLVRPPVIREVFQKLNVSETFAGGYR